MDNLMDDSGFITLEMIEAKDAEIERLRTELAISDENYASSVDRHLKDKEEIERLRLEFYHYENENTYKGNSIRHWYNKAMAYGKCLDEANRKNAKLQAVVDAAKSAWRECDGMGFESIYELEIALAALED